MNKLLQMTLIFLGLTSSVQSAFAGGDAANGEKLSAMCAACHGADGNSPSSAFPKLAGLGEKYLLKQMLDVKSGSRNIVEMTGLLNGFDEKQLADIAAFYAAKTMQLAGAKEIEVQVNSGAKVDGLTLGTKIYRSGNAETGVPACSGCHSPTGAGNGPAGYPKLGGQYAAYTVKQLKAFQAGNRANDDAKIMRMVAAQMSDAEIKAVAEFIAGLH